ncbi:MAG: regulatory protein RecX [Candidatus Nitronauta litoralis]|uniref:Regulatory protein RecX n=1 Tax=Candidatus Nitronauta litoralis TaxID=2705533 RepID=A0A7T0FYZ5_9BACT|nr:MAG: regulatory protein RecX [Candidatus Nitronauta litoralis]
MTGDDIGKHAKRAALRYLGYRDRSVSEMRAYLAKKDFSVKVIDETVQYLAGLGYLDDARFSMQFSRSRIESRGMGRFRLRYELVNKGVDEHIIDQVLDTLFMEFDEFQLARDCAEKKLPAWEGLPAQTVKRRLAGFLGRKGFAAETVYRTVKELLP